MEKLTVITLKVQRSPITTGALNMMDIITAISTPRHVLNKQAFLP